MVGQESGGFDSDCPSNEQQNRITCVECLAIEKPVLRDGLWGCKFCNGYQEDGMNDVEDEEVKGGQGKMGWQEKESLFMNRAAWQLLLFVNFAGGH